MIKDNRTFKEKVLDRYLAAPIIYDFIIVGIFAIAWYFFSKHYSITIKEENKLSEVSSEIGTALITITGFILTIITIIVTFKNTIRKGKKESNNDLFYNSEFYPTTISLLKNCVKLLLFLYILIYLVRLLHPIPIEILFYINFSAIFFSVLVFLRFLLILKIIISFQVSD